MPLVKVNFMGQLNWPWGAQITPYCGGRVFGMRLAFEPMNSVKDLLPQHRWASANPLRT